MHSATQRPCHTQLAPLPSGMPSSERRWKNSKPSSDPSDLEASRYVSGLLATIIRNAGKLGSVRG